MPVMVSGISPARCSRWPTCQRASLAVDWLTMTWPAVAGHFPSIRRCAHTDVRQTSGMDVLYCGSGRVPSSEYIGGANSPRPARRPSVAVQLRLARTGHAG